MHVLPIMGKRQFADIRPMEWMNLLKSIQREKGIIEQANRLRALCQEAYDLAKVTGRIEYNPLEGLHRFLETHKSENMHHVSEAEHPALLRELSYLRGESPYLFPSRTSQSKPKSETVFIMALRRLGYEGRQSPHGFRHIASTTLRNKGFRREHVESGLAHVVGGVEGVYNKAAYLEDRVRMMQWWADYLDDL